MQALARLHVAAASGLVDDAQLGRPRGEGEGCEELVDLGPAPAAGALRARLDGMVELLTEASRGAQVPALVVAAVVHAEIASARPFVRGNAVVARAMERAVVQALGLDKDLVRVLVGEAHDLVLDRRTVARAHAFDHARVQRRAIQPRADDVVRARRRVRDPATALRRMLVAARDVGKCGDRAVAGLFHQA